MICYKDTTFCATEGCQNKCGRKLTEQVKQEAIKWWGSDDAPIATAFFCDSDGEYRQSSTRRATITETRKE